MLVESNPIFSHYVSEWYKYSGVHECFSGVEFVPGNKYKLVEMGYGKSSKPSKLFGVIPWHKSLGNTYNVLVCTCNSLLPLCYSSKSLFNKYWTKCA